MANEATVRASLQIRLGNLFYQSNPTTFQASVGVAKGPVPGAITVGVGGTNVDFSQLVLPGLCILQNLDTINRVEYGTWDGAKFHPLGMLLAGEVNVIRLADKFTTDYGTTGTGSATPAAKFRLRAYGAPCVVKVEAFES